MVMPNPFYHVYAGAAAVAGAEPFFLPANRDNGFLPEPDSIPRRGAERARRWPMSARPPIRKAPSPRATIWRAGSSMRAGTTTRSPSTNATPRSIAATPPTGALEVAEGSLDNLVVLHSLSKRSSAPGLRSGFLAGDRRLIRRVTQLGQLRRGRTFLPGARRLGGACGATRPMWRRSANAIASALPSPSV